MDLFLRNALFEKIIGTIDLCGEKKVAYCICGPSGLSILAYYGLLSADLLPHEPTGYAAFWQQDRVAMVELTSPTKQRLFLIEIL